MRNHYMVDNSLYCVCYLVNQTGGTAYTVYMQKKRKIGTFLILPMNHNLFKITL